MTQPPHGTLTYLTIPEDDTEDPGNTEISVTAMPRSPTTPETVEKAIDTSKEQQAMSQPQERTMTGFTRQSSTAWRTTSIVQSGPVTSPPPSPPPPPSNSGYQESRWRRQWRSRPVTTTLQQSQVETKTSVTVRTQERRRTTPTEDGKSPTRQIDDLHDTETDTSWLNIYCNEYQIFIQPYSSF